MRERVGLTEGGDVEIDVQGAAILIESVPDDDLIRKDGFILIPSSGSTITDADVREQRLNDQR